jgi:hypothetical protein
MPTQLPHLLEGLRGKVVVLADMSFSDGDQSRWPKDDKYGRPDDTLYRAKLARMWLHKINALNSGLLFPLHSCQCSSLTVPLLPSRVYMSGVPSYHFVRGFP